SPSTGTASSVTVTTARARTLVPASVPPTSNVPACAYDAGSTASHVTSAGPVEPSAYVAVTVAGSTGAEPVCTVTATSSTDSTNASGWYVRSRRSYSACVTGRTVPWRGRDGIS